MKHENGGGCPPPADFLVNAAPPTQRNRDGTGFGAGAWTARPATCGRSRWLSGVVEASVRYQLKPAPAETPFSLPENAPLNDTLALGATIRW